MKNLFSNEVLLIVGSRMKCDCHFMRNGVLTKGVVNEIDITSPASCSRICCVNKAAYGWDFTDSDRLLYIERVCHK